MKRQALIALLIMILLGIVFFFILIVIIFNTGESDCEDYCKSRGTIFSEIKHTGNWGKDDLCVCYFEDSLIKTWRMPK